MTYTVPQIIETIGRQRLQDLVGVKGASIDKARAQDVFPASWFEAINKEVPGVPSSLFNMKRQDGGAV